MSFHNDGQFPVSHTALAGILHQYSIEDFSYSIATSGIENTTCIIETQNTKYALRIYRQAKKSLAAIERELAFMQKLRDKELSIPKIYLNCGKQEITQINLQGQSWEALLMEYMPGQHPTGYPTVLLRQMAHAQSIMHLASRELEQSDKAELTELVEGEFVRRIDKNRIKNEQLLDYIERAAMYKVELSTRLMCGYSHFDFDLGNILVDEHDQLSAILDFDDLQYAPLVICLGYTLWSVLYETNDKNALTSYLTEYQKARTLSTLELEYLPKIMLFRHYVITTLKILNGHVAKADVQKYKALEQSLQDMADKTS